MDTPMQRPRFTGQALTESPSMIEAAPSPRGLSAALRESSPLPPAALFLGLAADRLPVLLNLLDPIPGPVLIAGDAGSGKTAFLKLLARAAERVHGAPRAQRGADPAAQVRYGVVSAHPQEWTGFERSPHCLEILSSPTAAHFIASLVERAHAGRGAGESILLLVDDLEELAGSAEADQGLRWLLLRGPAHGVWPILTLNSGAAARLRPWLAAFHTRLFGRIADAGEAAGLGATPEARLDALRAGTEFLMREAGGWLRFRIPDLD